MRRCVNFLLACVVVCALDASVGGEIWNGDYNEISRDDQVILDMLEDVRRRSGGADDIPQTLLNNGLTTLYDKLEDQQFLETLRGMEVPLTLFAPTNEAFRTMKRWMQRRLAHYDALRRTLQYHVAPNAPGMGAWRDEMLLETLNGKSLRINGYPKTGTHRGYTVNCVPIATTSATPASNGVVHQMDAVLKIPYADVLTSLEACASVFSNFSNAMRMIGWRDLVSGPVTVFPPSDYTFQREFPQGVDSLFRNRAALRELVLSHVVSGTYCSAGIEEGQRLRTLSGGLLDVDTDEEGHMTINNVRLISRDAIVTDGVVHPVRTLLSRWP